MDPASEVTNKQFQSWVQDRTESGCRWISFAKGGSLSPFYCDLPLVIDWSKDGKELKEWSNHVNSGKGWSRNISKPLNTILSPGLTWPLRASRFSPAALPAGSIFSIRGYSILSDCDQLSRLCVFCSSSTFDYLFKVMLGRFGFPEFVVGVLQQLPVPPLEPAAQYLEEQFNRLFEASSFSGRIDETSRHFSICIPALIHRTTITGGANSIASHLAGSTPRRRSSPERDRASWTHRFRLYRLEGDDIAGVAALPDGRDQRSRQCGGDDSGAMDQH